MKNSFLVYSLIVLGIAVSTEASPPKEPWKCVWQILEKLKPQRPPIDEAAKSLEEQMRGHIDSLMVHSFESYYLLTSVDNSAEFLELATRYWLNGFQGYAVVSEVHASTPAEDEPNTMIWSESNLVVPDEMIEFNRKNLKLEPILRAQLASDHYRLGGQWDPERKILLSIHDQHLIFSPTKPSDEELSNGAKKAVTDFCNAKVDSLGLELFGQRRLDNGKAWSLLVTVPTREAFLEILAEPNVASADAAENLNAD